MNKVQNFIGIDVSKKWFDVGLLKKENPSDVKHHQFSQTSEGFKQFSRWLKENNTSINEETLFCIENTGIYNDRLVNFLLGKSAQIWVEMPLKIKRAGGFERGKDDKTDAKKIAWYAYRYEDRTKLWSPLESNLRKIKYYSKQRDRLMKAIHQLTVPINELRACDSLKEAAEMEKIQKPVIASLKRAKKEIENMIRQTIKGDEQLEHTASRVEKVTGVGPVVTTAMLIYTRGFQGFENAKQLACYCGVAPFTRSSGSSIRHKPAVSPFANKELKRLLHLGAISAIQNDPEIRQYYLRRVREGKDKMKVINAVRNKLVHRIFAVVRDDRDFEKNYIRKCA